jgi:hypothetical protein
MFKAATTLEVVGSSNLGRPTFIATCTIREFLERARTYNPKNLDDEDKSHIVGTATQRDEVPNHRKNMATFILRSLVSSTIENEYGDDLPSAINKITGSLGVTKYGALQPITCNIRDTSVEELTKGSAGIVERLGDNQGTPLNNVWHLKMQPKHLNWSIIDGNHRREAMAQVRDYLESVTLDYPDNGLFTPANHPRTKHDVDTKEFWAKVQNETFQNSSIKVELHIGLDEDQERQLFTHLNLHPKVVPQSLAQEFDGDNHLIIFTKAILDSSASNYSNIRKAPPAKRQIGVDWHDDDGSIMLKDAVTINSICMLGSTSSNRATPMLVKERHLWAEKMWSAINSIPHYGSKNHRTKTIAAQPVMLKGIAHLVMQLAPYSKKTHSQASLNKLLDALKTGELDFSHKNKIWRALFLGSDEERGEAYGKKICDYVFVSPHTNLIAGEFQKEKNWVRYGSRHNDIYKRLGDLIRYQLKLIPRDQTTDKKKAARMTAELEG